MIKNASFTQDAGGMRLDVLLLEHFPSSTRAFCKRAVESGMVSVNGKRTTRKGDKISPGAFVQIDELLEAADCRVRPCKSTELCEIFCDDALLAYDKPAGIPVQPIDCFETGTLMNAVVARHPETSLVGDSPLMAGALHRIDSGTSGLVIVARTNEAFATMRSKFAERQVKKTYLALVEGTFSTGGTIESDLAHIPNLPFCKMADVRSLRISREERAKTKPLHAVTQYHPVAHTTAGGEERTLLEITIYTGVTHQIRAQLSSIGIHIINDRLYGAFAIEHATGHCLHSWAANFNHPTSGDPVELRTALPQWAQI